jgi:hypothetical protein
MFYFTLSHDILAGHSISLHEPASAVQARPSWTVEELLIKMSQDVTTSAGQQVNETAV